MDLKKEIKLSDLFKRGPKETARKPEADVGAENPAKAKRASFSFLRGRPEGEAAVAAEPKTPKRKREGRRGKSTPDAVPAVPLMRAFDLLPRDDTRRRDGSRRPSTAQLVLAVVGLVLVAILGSFFLVTNARVADKQQTLDDLKAQLAATNVAAAKPAQAAAGPDAGLVQERDGRTSALAAALGSRVAWDRLLRDLSLVLPDDVWLKTLTGTTGTSAAAAGDPAAAAAPAGPGSFEIVGYTRAQDGVAQLLSRMAVLPEVQSAKLVSATRAVVAREPLVEFTISAEIKPAGAGGTT